MPDVISFEQRGTPVENGSRCTRCRNLIADDSVSFTRFLLNDHLCDYCAEQPSDSAYASSTIGTKKEAVP